mmetsp:Transcript_19002/g.39804  ORF Transcript_19002/g.39804 Transcript_19002/m.39804 type:complete len:345 (+) Transcript_19002:421-1455(+)
MGIIRVTKRDLGAALLESLSSMSDTMAWTVEIGSQSGGFRSMVFADDARAEGSPFVLVSAVMLARGSSSSSSSLSSSCFVSLAFSRGDDGVFLSADSDRGPTPPSRPGLLLLLSLLLFSGVSDGWEGAAAPLSSPLLVLLLLLLILVLLLLLLLLVVLLMIRPIWCIVSSINWFVDFDWTGLKEAGFIVNAIVICAVAVAVAVAAAACGVGADLPRRLRPDLERTRISRALERSAREFARRSKSRRSSSWWFLWLLPFLLWFLLPFFVPCCLAMPFPGFGGWARAKRFGSWFRFLPLQSGVKFLSKPNPGDFVLVGFDLDLDLDLDGFDLRFPMVTVVGVGFVL